MRRTARPRFAPTRQQYEELLETLDRRPHIIKANGVWGLPRAPESFGRAVGFILNDWQLAGVLTAGSGTDATI